MSSQLDLIKTLKGKKVVDVKLDWDDRIDDYYLDSIIFDDGTVMELWGDDYLARWEITES